MSVPDGKPPGYSPQFHATPQTAPTQVTVVRSAVVQPNDYFALALMVTLFCCLPFGILGIVKSMEVKSKFAAGDLAGAEAASTAAKKWSLVGLVCGIVFEVIFVIIVIIYYATAVSVYSAYSY